MISRFIPTKNHFVEMGNSLSLLHLEGWNCTITKNWVVKVLSEFLPNISLACHPRIFLLVSTERITLATCNTNQSNLQSRHFQTRIKCNYNYTSARINCNWTRIKCNQPAIIRFDQDYLQLTETPIKSLLSSLLKKRSNCSTKLFELQPGLIATIKVKKTVVSFTVSCS
jgi:hypothetical protein